MKTFIIYPSENSNYSVNCDSIIMNGDTAYFYKDELIIAIAKEYIFLHEVTQS